MSDLISRKAVIEAMEQRYCDIERVKKCPVTKGEQAIFLDMRGVVRSLPSWGCRMSDLISRADAIEAMCRECGNLEEYGDCSSCGCAEKNAIEELPSAEPVGVIRCKDCKHYKKINPKAKSGMCYKDIVASAWNDDGFCSRGERKGGDEE